MTELEWFASDEPDLMLEHLMGRISRAQLVMFVRQCWQRIAAYLPPVPHEYTVVEQFEEIVHQLSDYDAVIYASEAALKASRLAPDAGVELRHQANLLRRIVGNAFRTDPKGY
jgi:hypothetical protein